jgi:hypothetical protein
VWQWLRSTYGDVVELVVVRVALSDGVRSGSRERVVVGNVGYQTTHVLRRASSDVEVAEELGRRPNVGRPTEPAGVSSIEVHVHTDGVQLLDRVCNGALVSRRGVRALLDVQVGDQVCQRVGLNRRYDGNGGVRLIRACSVPNCENMNRV